VCSWCQDKVSFYGSTTMESMTPVYNHLTRSCTHEFECRYCPLVDQGSWRQLKYRYTGLVTHCKVHRLAFTLLHRIREMMFAIYPNPGTFDLDKMQFWVSHLFSLVQVIEIESRQCLFSDLGHETGLRANTIRRRIGQVVAGPNVFTAELAPSFHEFILNTKWVRQDRPPNVMEVLPAMIRLIYQDQEPTAITDPDFLQAFVTEANNNGGIQSPPPPERNGARLLANILELAQSTFPPPPPPPTLLVRPNQYAVLRPRVMLQRTSSQDSEDGPIPPDTPPPPPFVHRAGPTGPVSSTALIRVPSVRVGATRTTGVERPVVVVDELDDGDFTELFSMDRV
jgi:hypothetical protein